MNEKNKVVHETGYGLISQSVMRNKDLPITAKAIYGYLASFAGNKRSAYPSVSLMLSELGMSRDTFYKYQKELVDKGYIEIEKQQSKDGKFLNNVYYLNTPCPKSSYTVKPTTVNLDTNSNSIKSNSIKKEKLNKKKETNIFLERVYFENQEVNDLFIDYLEMRIEKKYTMSERAIKLLLGRLKGHSDSKKIELLGNAILGGWKSIFVNDNFNQPKKTEVPYQLQREKNYL